METQNPPLSGSTRITTTTSFRPSRINFCTDRIRLRDSSDRRIIPSMPSYSSCRRSAAIRSQPAAVCSTAAKRGRRTVAGTHQLDVCSHFLDRLHLDHDQLVHLCAKRGQLSDSMVHSTASYAHQGTCSRRIGAWRAESVEGG